MRHVLAALALAALFAPPAGGEPAAPQTPATAPGKPDASGGGAAPKAKRAPARRESEKPKPAGAGAPAPASNPWAAPAPEGTDESVGAFGAGRCRG